MFLDGHAFRTDYLGLDNLTGDRLSPEKTDDFPSHSWPTTPHVGEGSCEISPCTLGLQPVSLQHRLERRLLGRL